MLALWRYTISHVVILAVIPDKGKSKGKNPVKHYNKVWQSKTRDIRAKYVIAEDLKMDKYIFDENNGL